MKKLIFTISVFFMMAATYGQPTTFKYQTIVRDGGGEIIANQSVSFQLSILQGNPAGTNIYTETHTTATNQFGLANLEIGNGSVVSGDFATIDWGADDYFLEISFDINGGTNYLLAGTSQLMAVPYALYAKNSGGSSAWQATGDNIYFNDGNVGIGTDSPATKFHVRGQNFTFEDTLWSYFMIKSLGEGDPVLELHADDDIWDIRNDDSEGNKFNIRHNNSTKLAITSDGNLGIGTNNPGSKLDVHGATRFTVRLNSDGRLKVGNLYSSDDTLALVSFGNAEISIDDNDNLSGKVFRVVHNGDEELLRVQDDGKVGIGTSSPTDELHIYHPSENGLLTLQSGDPEVNMWLRDNTSGDNSTSPFIGGIGKKLYFGVNGAKRMYIDQDGKVGIGTSTPSRMFHVYGGNAQIEAPEWCDLTIRTSEPGTDAFLTLRTSTDGIWANDNYWGFYNDASDANKLSVLYNGANKFTITSDGKVGIGTSNPQSMLEVAGRISQSGIGNSIFIGKDAGLNDDLSENENIAIGSETLYNNSLSTQNVAIGYKAMWTAGDGGEHSSDKNTCVGYKAFFENWIGYDNTAIGHSAGINSAGDFFCTFIGSSSQRIESGPQFFNSTAIGRQSIVSASSQVRIGNSYVNSIGGYASWTNISDERFKVNANENVPGLDFINKLRPVTYQLDIEGIDRYLGIQNPDSQNEKYKEGSDKKKLMIQTGFIAQEVEDIAHEIGYDFSGIDAPANENDLYGLRYAEFVVPLVKAIQEQQKMIEEQTIEIQNLKDRVKNLELEK